MGLAGGGIRTCVVVIGGAQTVPLRPVVVLRPVGVGVGPVSDPARRHRLAFAEKKIGPDGLFAVGVVSVVVAAAVVADDEAVVGGGGVVVVERIS